MKTAKTLSIYSFMKRFHDEESAVKFFEQQIWGDEPICPHCGSKKTSPRINRKGHRCKKCRNDFTIRKGTIFENSRLPLHKWLYAMYLLVTARKGISSLQLSKELDITQKSAWFLLQRIREACNNNTEMLSGIVEIDETYIGGKEKNKHESKKTGKRGTTGKMGVLGMRERNGKVKAMPILNNNKAFLHHVIGKNVKDGSTIYTDEHASYLGLYSYKHKTVNHSAKEYVNGMAHTNGIESVWAVLKRGFYGVYHKMSIKHLHRYVNEFIFRLNEGNCKIDTIDRMKSLAKGTEGKRLTYKKLIT